MKPRYPVRNHLPFTPPDVPEHLLTTLSQALYVLDPVVRPTLSELTVNEIEKVLNSLAQKDGQHLMLHLGLRKLAPRRFGPTLSEQVLKRLQGISDSADLEGATALLTTRVIHDSVRQAVEEHAGRSGPDRPLRWSENVLRLAVFSHLTASALDARVVLWAADRDWLGVEAEKSVLEAIRAAAVDLVTATPGFPEDLVPQRPSGDRPGHATREPEEPAAASPSAGREAEGAEEQGGKYEEPVQPPEDSTLEDARDAVVRAMSTAQDAVERMRGALAAGSPPGDDDQRTVTEVAPAFARALALLDAAGSPGIAPRLLDITEATAARVDASRRDTLARARLATVRMLVCPYGGPVADVLAGAREQAEALLSTTAWSASESDRAHVLGLLADLVEVRDRSGTGPELTEAQQKLSAAHAPYAVAAVLHDQIVVSAPAGLSVQAPTQRSNTVPQQRDTTGKAEVARELPAHATHEGADPAVTATSPPAAGDGSGGLDAPSGLPGTVAETAGGTLEGSGTSEDITATAPEDDTETNHSAVEVHPPAGTDPTGGDSARLVKSIAADMPPTDGPGEGRTERRAVPGNHTSAPPAQHTAALGNLTSAGDVELALARLVSERRFGLAAHIAAAAERSRAEVTALRLAGAVTALRTPTDKAAVHVAELLRNEDRLADADADGVPLVLLPSLVRAALVTGDLVVGAQLKTLSTRFSGALAEMAAVVADATLKGALLAVPPSTVVADVSGTEARLRETVDACRTQLKGVHLRLPRATRMVKGWLKPEGELGSALTAIVNGVPDAEERAQRLADTFCRKADIEALIDKADAALRGSSGSVIQGAVRTGARQFVERTCATVRAWQIARQSAARHTTDNAWAFDEVAALRNRLLALRGQAVADLDSAGTRTTPLTRAAAFVARAVLTDALDELEHGASASLPLVTADTTRVLDAELEKIAPTAGDLPDDSRHRPVDLSTLLLAVSTTWSEAIACLHDRDAFASIRDIFVLADQGVLPDSPTLTLSAQEREELLEREAQRSSRLRSRAGELTTLLHLAQSDGALTVVQDVELQELLADAGPHTESGTPRPLHAIRHNLDRVEELLPRYRKEAADRLRARLHDLPAEPAETRARILRYLEDDNLATATELAYFFEIGEPEPDITSYESHLDAFLPAVPTALPDGITPGLIDAVRSRSSYGGAPALDYSGLSREASEQAAQALELWSKLSATTAINQINPRVDLRPALALLGYEAKSAVPDRMQGRDHRFYELTGVQVSGRAWAPAFGSHIADAGRKLRTLLLWGRPSAQHLLSRIMRDPSEDSLLVVHFGTMDVRTRTELATASRNGRPVMVVDDAALAYLTARGDRRADATTETLLPFSAVNPYIKEKRGRIGREMFYGRDHERKSILDPQGTQILYGGRGLGKSALLADAGDRFVEQRPGKHLAIYLNLDTIGISRNSALGAAAIWSALADRLTKADVLAEPRRKEQNPDHAKRVREGVDHWLMQDPDRRLLVLLDECDNFFEADLPDCTETSRLRGLGEPFHGRTKVVFAGLHSVVRFTSLASNTPFNQMTQTPTVIGPLAPQFAADLIVHPLRALGFEFAGVDLVNRILGHCSYQPFLLQIFGSRLVDVLQAKRSRTDAPPPYVIESADVDAIERDHGLRSDIQAAFRATLELDHRYKVIALVLAQQAREHGLETRLSDRDIRSECDYWWHDGFAGLDSSGFRAYLEEMVGLGVLAPNHDGRGWHLRGPNALRMVGTAQEIEMWLIRAKEDCRLEEAILQASRPKLNSGRSAPLTVNEIHYLLGNGGNQVRVVLGTEATGIDAVEATLREATGHTAGWATPPIGSAGAHRTALIAGHAGERRLLISDLAKGADKPCRESYERATTLFPTVPDAGRSVVLVSGPEQLEFWRERLAADAVGGQDTVLALRRYDARALQGWAGAHSLCESEERLGRLAEVTGGWPYLLNQALDLRARHHGDQDRILRDLSQWTSERDRMEEFAEATGVRSDQGLLHTWAALVEHLGTGWHPDGDCQAAAQLAGLPADQAASTLACLEAMQTIDRDGTLLRIEPLLHRVLTALGEVPRQD